MWFPAATLQKGTFGAAVFRKGVCSRLHDLSSKMKFYVYQCLSEQLLAKLNKIG